MLLLDRTWDTNLPTIGSFLNDFFGNDDFLNNKKTTKKVNIVDNGDSYTISVQLPGYSKEDVNVELHDDVLTISSKVEKEDKKEDKNYIVREYYKSSFENSFRLPEDVNKEGVEAEMKDGILSLKLNKVKEIEDTTNVKKIDIK